MLRSDVTPMSADFLACNTGAFEFFGGALERVVLESLKVAVMSGCRYEPYFNCSYVEVLHFFGMIVVPRSFRAKEDAVRDIGRCALSRCGIGSSSA